jgi:hypothetical protein
MYAGRNAHKHVFLGSRRSPFVFVQLQPFADLWLVEVFGRVVCTQNQVNECFGDISTVNGRWSPIFRSCTHRVIHITCTEIPVTVNGIMHNHENGSIRKQAELSEMVAGKHATLRKPGQQND